MLKPAGSSTFSILFALAHNRFAELHGAMVCCGLNASEYPVTCVTRKMSAVYMRTLRATKYMDNCRRNSIGLVTIFPLDSRGTRDCTSRTERKKEKGRERESERERREGKGRKERTIEDGERGDCFIPLHSMCTVKMQSRHARRRIYHVCACRPGGT